MRLLTRMIGAAATLSLALPAAAQQIPVAVTVTVDTSKPGPRIERDVYGQFAEHLGRGIYEGIWVGSNSRIPNTKGYRTDVVEALRRIKVPSVRWPGGCFADEYDWRDGIGARAQRPTRVNTHWGGVTEDNAFGTHEFMNFAELIGAQAYIAGNMGSMGPREMGQWVEYMTSDSRSTLANERRRNGRDKPWKVAYFGVGNESWGCGGNMRPEYSADLHKRYSTFVKAPPEMGMKKVASGASVDDYAFTEMLMDRARAQMDAVSMHHYTFTNSWEEKGNATGFSEADWASVMVNALRMDELVTRHSAIMDKYDPEKRVGLYVDEWGTWYNPEPGSTPGFLYQQNTLRDAQVAALTLNIFHRHTDRVKLAAIAQMVNVLQAMILTDGAKMVLTPTYHLFDMYVPFQGATPYAAFVTNARYTSGGKDLPMIDTSVARATDGTLWMALVNLDPNRPARIATNLTGTAIGRILTAAAMDAHNSFENPNAIAPAAYSGTVIDGKLGFDLPAKAIAMVQIAE
ncbi:alpha-N-arabinofuranosidase [Sphingomonas japonica]|uniref:non-reducing end alpha-L-arabinofuranosidase n=1 Tax=Sphingomonas japonica TaxID=511662 RepID=A0ABX0U0D6_9SPHN|nr:alpha-L-arabinofuranosidase C-terminal domain-containing protein [Sphingomonas japonica]NIJ23560.1 alpha-N-arabinofuranosidase [Sphingomonas japonica]